MQIVLRRLSCLAIAVTALGAASAISAYAQDKKPLELRYTTGAPAKTPWVMQLERFAKDVEDESKGGLKIEQFIAAQLGNEQDTAQQIARGRIDMGGFSNGAVALLTPEIALLGLPFFFKDTAEQDCALDNHMTKPVNDALAKKSVKFLGWTEVGTADVIGKRPFVSPKDVGGLKAASASNKVSAATWTALGANPNAIGITEIASAFQTRTGGRAGHRRHLLSSVRSEQGGAGADPRRAVRCTRHHHDQQGQVRRPAEGHAGGA